MNGRTRRGRPRHPDVLTPAEWRVVNAVRHGMSNRGIVRVLGISLDGVKFHLSNAVAKLELHGRAELKQWRGAPMTSALREQESTMRGNLTLGAIGQIARSVSDIQEAEAWYRDVLGLPHLFTFGNLAFFDCGGTRLFLEGSGSPKNESLLYFRVDDINAAYDTLSQRGAMFEGAPHLIHRHENGVEEWMAFFKDPDGRLLAIMAQVAPASQP